LLTHELADLRLTEEEIERFIFGTHRDAEQQQYHKPPDHRSRHVTLLAYIYARLNTRTTHATRRSYFAGCKSPMQWEGRVHVIRRADERGLFSGTCDSARKHTGLVTLF
jgi:RNase P subunit RPR2